MKKPLFFLLFTALSLSLSILLTGLDIDQGYGGQYLPVFMKRAEMEKAVKMESAYPLRNTGKIYLYKQFILINEKYKGIHIIDNSTPSTPVNKGFLHIDGCIDMAMNGDILYADNAVDLIALKFDNNFTSVQVTERLKAVFPEIESPDGIGSRYYLNKFRPTDAILVAWKKKN